MNPKHVCDKLYSKINQSSTLHLHNFVIPAHQSTAEHPLKCFLCMHWLPINTFLIFLWVCNSLFHAYKQAGQQTSTLHIEYLEVFLEASDAICSSLLQLFSGYLEVGSCHLCLPTHHQLTQGMVDEDVLRLRRKRIHCRNTLPTKMYSSLTSLHTSATALRHIRQGNMPSIHI